MDTQKIKALLISTNNEKNYPYPVPPIGAGMVCEQLKKMISA